MTNTVKFSTKSARAPIVRSGSGGALPICAVSQRVGSKLDEPAQLRALARLDILDTAPEQSFERIVELVRQIFLQRPTLL